MMRSVLDLALCDDPSCHVCASVHRHRASVLRRADRAPVAPLGGQTWARCLILLGVACAGMEIAAQFWGLGA